MMMKSKIVFALLMAIFMASCSSKSNIPKADEVYQITKKVADWQIDTWEDQGKYRALPAPENRKKWHNRDKHDDLSWIAGAFYAGLFQFTEITEENKYEDWLTEMGMRNNWTLGPRTYHADDQAVGQMFLSLHRRTAKGYMMEPTKKQFTQIMNSEKANNWHWHWCDALFMAPPAWARLANITSYRKILVYMDKQYHMTYDKLWDKEEQLFFRDKSYFDKKEKNGEKLFWSRGNGWVYGGLALMIPELPKGWEGYDFYTQLFQQMSETLVRTQRPDGTWSAGLLGDVKDYPNIETSGTSFFTFGLAWGINNGILDKETYEPVLLKAWNSLTNAVTKDGMLAYVQPVGAAPGASYANYTEVYGSGAFLAAGSEMYKYIQKFYPVEEMEQESPYATFMTHGGWCWYQDPRVIINNGKLIVGGLDGVNGDVNIGVFDLKTETADGQVKLHPELQADDHNTPALYARPDGSILAMWAKHGREKKHYYNISSPTDYLKWGEKMEYIYDYPDPRGVTYMNLYYLKDVDKLYNFYRDGETYNPSFITSDDHGKTWGNRTHFVANDVKGRQRPYVRYAQIDENTVGISYTDAHPRQYGNSLYYAEFRNGTFYTVDGKKIKDITEGPLHTSEGEKIFKGSEKMYKPEGCESVPFSAWSCATASDADGNPYQGYTLYINNNDHRYRIANWDGEKWNDREIAYAGNCLYYVESSYTGLMAFDPTDPTKVYISTDVNPSTGEDLGGKHEIYGATIGPKDDVFTIKWEAITQNSKYKNIRPIVVAGDGYKVLLWLNGPWHTFVNYDVNVIGKILEKPE